MSNESAHLAAVVALLNTVDGNAYTLGDLDKLKAVDKPLPASYNEVHVMERLGDGPRRTSLPAQTTQWRVLIRSVAQKFPNAQEMRRRAALLHESRLTVADELFGIERSTSDDPIAPDDGWWSGTSEFIY